MGHTCRRSAPRPDAFPDAFDITHREGNADGEIAAPCLHRGARILVRADEILLGRLDGSKDKRREAVASYRLAARRKHRLDRRLGTWPAIDLADPARDIGFIKGRRIRDEIAQAPGGPRGEGRSEEHTSELHSLMRTSYAVFCLHSKNYNSHPA